MSGSDERNRNPFEMLNFLIGPILIALVVSSSKSSAREPTDTLNDLCGVHLRPQALVVQRYVQDHTKQPVDCKVKVGLRQSMGVLSLATMEHHFPEILLDSIDGINETQVTHELFHLKLDVDGMPQPEDFATLPQTQREKNIGVSASRSLRISLTSYLQHRLFFKDMTAMGLRPYASDDPQINRFIEMGKQDSSKYLPESLTLNLLPVLDRPTDVRLPVEKYYREQGWDQQVEKAIVIHKLIEGRNPKTRDQMVTTFRECWAILFPLV